MDQKKTTLIPLILWCVCNQTEKWAAMYLCVSGIDFACFYEFSIGSYNYFDSMVFLVFHFFNTMCKERTPLRPRGELRCSGRMLLFTQLYVSVGILLEKRCEHLYDCIIILRREAKVHKANLTPPLFLFNSPCILWILILSIVSVIYYCIFEMFWQCGFFSFHIGILHIDNILNSVYGVFRTMIMLIVTVWQLYDM
jgi:hypothetical protein